MSFKVQKENNGTFMYVRFSIKKNLPSFLFRSLLTETPET